MILQNNIKILLLTIKLQSLILKYGEVIIKEEVNASLRDKN